MLDIFTWGENTHIALDSDSYPLEECDPPIASLPECEGVTVESKKGASSKRNHRTGMLIITRSYMRQIYVH